MKMPTIYWKSLPGLKSLLITKHGKVCQKCGKAVARKTDLAVHHLNYKTLGREQIDVDVTLFCHACHKAAHGQ